MTSLIGTPVTGNNASSGTVSATFTQPSGSNRKGFAVVEFYNSASKSCGSVSWGGASMTKILESGNTIPEKLSIWMISETSLPSNGSQTVTATLAASDTSPILVIHVFMFDDLDSGSYQTYGDSPYVSGSSNTSTINLTTTSDNSLVITCAASNSPAPTSFTHGTGQVEITDKTDTGSLSTSITVTTSYEIVSSAGAVTQTDICTDTDRLVGIGVSFSPNASAPSGFFLFM